MRINGVRPIFQQICIIIRVIRIKCRMLCSCHHESWIPFHIPHSTCHYFNSSVKSRVCNHLNLCSFILCVTIKPSSPLVQHHSLYTRGTQNHTEFGNISCAWQKPCILRHSKEINNIFLSFDFRNIIIFLFSFYFQ